MIFTKTLSRADLSQEGAGSFSEGDCIGLYVACEGNISYRELTLTGGEWYPRLKRSEFGKGRLTLSAHYPVLPESSRISPESSSFFALFPPCFSRSVLSFPVFALTFPRLPVFADYQKLPFSLIAVAARFGSSIPHSFTSSSLLHPISAGTSAVPNSHVDW